MSNKNDIIWSYCQPTIKAKLVTQKSYHYSSHRIKLQSLHLFPKMFFSGMENNPWLFHCLGLHAGLENWRTKALKDSGCQVAPSSGPNTRTWVGSYLCLYPLISHQCSYWFFFLINKGQECVCRWHPLLHRVCPNSLLFWFKPLVAFSPAWIVINGVESDTEMNSEVSL